MLAVRPDLRLVALADGAEENWRYFDRPAWRNAIKIVDFWHACEHIQAGLQTFYGANSVSGRAEFGRLRVLLRDKDNGVEEVLKRFRSIYRKLRSKARRKKLLKEMTYFENQRERMQYAEYQEQGLPIGSGVVEAACKTLAVQRMKRSGMSWRHGKQGILSIRSLQQSSRWRRGWELVAAEFRKDAPGGMRRASVSGLRPTAKRGPTVPPALRAAAGRAARGALPTAPNPASPARLDIDYAERVVVLPLGSASPWTAVAGARPRRTATGAYGPASGASERSRVLDERFAESDRTRCRLAGGDGDQAHRVDAVAAMLHYPWQKGPTWQPGHVGIVAALQGDDPGSRALVVEATGTRVRRSWLGQFIKSEDLYLGARRPRGEPLSVGQRKAVASFVIQQLGKPYSIVGEGNINHGFCRHSGEEPPMAWICALESRSANRCYRHGGEMKPQLTDLFG